MASNSPIAGPLSLGELLDRAFRLYRSRFGTLVLLAAIFLIPFGIISGVLAGESLLNSFETLAVLFTDPEAVPTTNPFETMGESQLGIYFLTSIIGGFLVNTIVILALTSQVIAVLHGTPMSLGQSLRHGLRRFWSYLGMFIVRGLALFGVYMGAGMVMACVAIAVIFAIAGGASAFGSAEPDFSPVGMVGFIILLLCFYGLILAAIGGPVLYLLARWLVVTPALIDQQLGPMAALRTSWQLTKGNVRRVFFYAVLLGILYFVAFGLLSFTVQWILVIALGSLMPATVAAALSGAFNGLLGVLWQPLFVAAVVLLYYDLRVRHESYDLSQRIDRMASSVAPTGSDPFMLLPDEPSKP